MASILNIGKRLETIVDLCEPTKIIADLGCDHGLVTAELILQDKAQMVIATEISSNCLNKAVLLADSINITPFVSFREGNGFDAITKYDKINLAIIAGMGGMEIINILKKKPKHLFNFILQPMHDVIKLREFLISNNFKIEVDKLVQEGDKFYNIIKVTKGKNRLADLEVYFGLTNFTDNYEVFYNYLITQRDKYSKLKESVGELSSSKELELKYILEALSLFKQEPEKTEENKDEEITQEDINSENLNDGGKSDLVNEKLQDINVDQNNKGDNNG